MALVHTAHITNKTVIQSYVLKVSSYLGLKYYQSRIEEYNNVKFIMDTIVNFQTDLILENGFSLIGGHVQVEIVRSLFDTKMMGCWMVLEELLVISALHLMLKLKV